tara:strand:+ start:1723 stop:3534 length:1812 start_codon:yes stop_codon:yes gene_type:complete
MPIIIFCRKSIWEYLLFWYKKYIISSDKLKLNSVVIDENCKIDAPEYRLSDYKASEIENNIIADLLDTDSLKYIDNFYKKNYFKYMIGERILYESQRILHSYSYIKKIIKHYAIDENIYIWPLDFDIKIFNLIKKYNILPNNIKLHPIARIYLYMKHFIKNIYFIIKTSFYIEYKLITAKFSSKKKMYKYCIQMDDGLLGYDLTPDDLLIDGIKIKKEEVIFTGIGMNNNSWVNLFKSKGLNVINIHKKLTLLKDFKYIISFYKKFFILKFKTIKALIKNPSLSSNLFNRYKNEIIWDGFYNAYNIDKIISIMIADDITASVIHKKNNVKSYFIFLSSTESILEGIKKINYSEIHEYTHIMYDVFIGSNFAINYMKAFDSSIGEYIEVDPILSDIVINKSNQDSKVKFLKNISYPTPNDEIKVISFLDTSHGEKGVLNYEAYGLFLSSINKLSSLYPEYLYLLKTKKPFSYLNDQVYGRRITDFKDISNIEYANDLGISSYEVMSLSDIVISGPESSVLYEALYAGKKTICYDPQGRYKSFKSLSHIIPKCTAYNYDELLKILNYWLNISDLDHQKYKEKYVQKFFMNKIGSGKNINKLRTCI